MTQVKRVLFGAYAPVHFLCFRPVYEILRKDPDVEIWLTGGFRRKDKQAGTVSYDLAGFYEPYGVDMEFVRPFEELPEVHYDAVLSTHSSTIFFPESYGKSVQMFHGVSFKNFSVRDKVLNYDFACVVGSYHAGRFESEGILGEGKTRFFMTGFAKLDTLVTGPDLRVPLLKGMGLDPGRPTILYAPTGGKYNSLDEMGEELITAIRDGGNWNLLIKPHDHPKKAVDWMQKLAPLESERIKLVRDFDIITYLAAADLLLTDASSVSMEYALRDRPMVFVDVPKLLTNVMERGGSLDLDTFGRRVGSIAYGPDDVAAKIASALANPTREGELRRRAAAEMFHDAGHAAENVAGVIRLALDSTAELPAGVQELTPSGSAS
jgi:hypothetical protein